MENMDSSITEERWKNGEKHVPDIQLVIKNMRGIIEKEITGIEDKLMKMVQKSLREAMSKITEDLSESIITMTTETAAGILRQKLYQYFNKGPGSIIITETINSIGENYVEDFVQQMKQVAYFPPKNIKKKKPKKINKTKKKGEPND